MFWIKSKILIKCVLVILNPNYILLEHRAILNSHNSETEKTSGALHKYGNNSTASIPLVLDEAIREGKLRTGDLVILVGFGAGLTYGANLVRL
jgi:3-oxoacyl-[acyl-carrier-protein] synthase III